MTLAGSTRQAVELFLPVLLRACEEVYGERLITVAIFGSTGRGTARPDSDVDLLLIADPLPDGTRLAEFGARRIWLGNAWYWDLKPDYRPGEVFEL